MAGPTQRTRSGSESARSGSSLLAFATVHKRALGVAVGTVLGALVFVVTVVHAVLQPENAPRIGLLSEYFYGYQVSWLGACIGLIWGFVTGFLIGWFTAFVRNSVIATRISMLRAKAELVRDADFLDHI